MWKRFERLEYRLHHTKYLLCSSKRGHSKASNYRKREFFEPVAREAAPLEKYSRPNAQKIVDFLNVLFMRAWFMHPSERIKNKNIDKK